MEQPAANAPETSSQNSLPAGEVSGSTPTTSQMSSKNSRSKNILKKAGLILLLILLVGGAIWVWGKFSKDIPGRSVNVASGPITPGTTSHITIIADCCGSYILGAWQHDGLVAGDFLLVGVVTYSTPGATDGPASSNELGYVDIQNVSSGASYPLTRVPDGFVATGTAWPSQGSCGFPSDCSEKHAGIGVQYWYLPGGIPVGGGGSYYIMPQNNTFMVGLASAFHGVNFSNPFVDQLGGKKTVSKLDTSAMTVKTTNGGWAADLLGLLGGLNITPTAGMSQWNGSPYKWGAATTVAMSRSNSATTGADVSVGWTCTGCSTFPNQMAVALNPAPPDPPIVGSLGNTLPVCPGLFSGSGITFNWAWAGANGATSLKVQITSSASFATDYTDKTPAGGAGATSTDGSIVWANHGSSILADGSNLLNLPPGTYHWQLVETNTSGTITTAGPDIVIPDCPPADASGLTAVPSCLGSDPQVLFRWDDNSTNEDLFWLDVNTAPWTGPSAPSPWGVKTINRTALEKSGTGLGTVTYVWQISDPLVGTPTIPSKSTTYYWRVKAHSNAGGDSAHVYPVPASFTTGNCGASALKVEFDNSTWTDNTGNSVAYPGMSFQPNDTAHVFVIVTSTTPTLSPTTDLYIYYRDDGVNMPDCSLSPQRPASGIPLDSGGVPRSYHVPAISSSSAPLRIPVTFKIGAAGNTAYAYVVPDCGFDASPWRDTFDAQTYVVNSKGFFETQGGDVGAKTGQSISVGFDSSTIPAPGQKYQSDYLIAAGTIDTKVHSGLNGWMLNGYDQKQVSSAGIYDFFANKFKDQAKDNDCKFTTSVNVIQICDEDLVFKTTDTAPTGNKVFFVDGNLELQKNLVLSAADSVVFIVKGDIVVDTSVTPVVNRIDGVYVARHSFIDHNTADPALVAVTDALTVNGAVYVDTLDDGHAPGLIDLKRYFLNGADNGTTAPVKIVYDPKYLISMRDIIGVKSIKWSEVAP